MFFELSTAAVAVVLIVTVFGAAVAGAAIGLRRRKRPDADHQPVGVVQGVMLGLVGLLLAFGLTMSVGRYDTRRALVVQEANAIGTTYLRAQMLAEPVRTRSLDLLRRYGDLAVDLADHVPDSDPFDADVARIQETQQALWGLAGDAVRDDPRGTAPRLYVETLNEMIDSHTDRVTSVGNRVPGTVLVLQVVGSAVAIFVLALYLALLGRRVATAMIAAAVVTLILFISVDLDRPHRGLITVPDSALASARAMMDLPPAAEGP
jgi:hypothetical protein